MPSSDTDRSREATKVAPRKRARRGVLRVLFWPALVGAAIFAAGFVVFANSLPRSETRLSRSADGIVVLTGGASRIVDAVELLSAGNGKRLLISGVNPSTTHAELIRMNPEVEKLLVGRIDLGHEATNTIGNAIETGHWARQQQFRSLIVVTSGWHMPRALVEIAHEVPEMTLIPHPVVSERMREAPWWSDLPTVRLLAVEYVKYVAALVRVSLDPSRLFGRRQHES